MHFPGSLDVLKAHVAALDLPGHWSHEGVFEVFRLKPGEMINFWPGSGKLGVAWVRGWKDLPARAAVPPAPR